MVLKAVQGYTKTLGADHHYTLDGAEQSGEYPEPAREEIRSREDVSASAGK